jgi:hypothetical protein
MAVVVNWRTCGERVLKHHIHSATLTCLSLRLCPLQDSVVATIFPLRRSYCGSDIVSLFMHISDQVRLCSVQINRCVYYHATRVLFLSSPHITATTTPSMTSTSLASDDFDDLNDVTSSPIRPPATQRGVRRRRSTAELDDDVSDTMNSSHTVPSGTSGSRMTINQNTVNAIRRFATSKRLKTDQMTEVDAFINVRANHLSPKSLHTFIASVGLCHRS